MPPLGQPPLQLRRRRLLLRRPAAARHVGTRPPAASRRQPAAVPALQGKSLLDRRLGQTFGQERLRPCAWKDTLSTLSCTLGRTLRLPAGAAWTAAAPTRARLELQRNGLSGSADTRGGGCLHTNDAQAAPAPPSMNTMGTAHFACHHQD